MSEHNDDCRYRKPQYSGGPEYWESGPPDIHGGQFGVDIVPREEHEPLFLLYSEDDTVWHFKFQASVAWIDDLIGVLQRAKKQLQGEGNELVRD